MKFYSTKQIDKTEANYRMVIGERSNGKSFAVLERILQIYTKTGKQGAILRRWQDDIKGKRASTMWDGVVAAGLVEKYTNGEYNNIIHKSGKFYLAKWDEKLNRFICDENPIAFLFALSSMEHDKSTSYPNVTTIMFDEFLTRSMYLNDEFVLFMNCCSTIIRYRTDVTIYMLANTVSQSAPYFAEMGIKHVSKMKPGDIDVYTYGDSSLKVAVELCNTNSKQGKPSDVYFAFDNPKLKMITGGAWEMDIYPHCPIKWTPEQVRLRFFIIWEIFTLQGEIVKNDDTIFCYIHRKTSELKNPDEDVIFCPEYDVRRNWSRKITKPKNKKEKIISDFFRTDNVYYQDNEVGEIVQNYINWCISSK